MDGETITYMGTLWLQIEDNTVTIGVNDDGTEAISSISKVDLPAEGETVEADEICGEIETDDGPFNVFSPINGRVIEINGAVLENHALILEDPYAEGWLLKIEAEDADELNQLINGASYEQ